MSAPQSLILGIFPSLGGGIESQRKDGREGLFLNYYLPQYLKKFEKIHYFSYSAEKPLGDLRVHVCENKSGIHKYLYTFLIPFIYAKELRECNLIRVMHTTGVIPAILSKVMYGTPFVTTYGYDYVNFARIEGHPLKALLLKCLLPIFLKMADGVIVTTEELKTSVEKSVGKTDKVRLVPNGVDTSSFKTERNGEVHKPFRLLFIGRLERQKNIPFLLDIISELKKHHDIQLTMVGSGSLETECKNRVQNENLPVEFKGSIPYESIRAEHAKADCFISTTFAEGHPKALIEAMSSGLVCAVSDAAGNRTLIYDEKTGRLLPNGNLEVWISALSDIIQNHAERIKLSNGARNWIVENFDIYTTLQKELNFLSENIK